MNPSDSTTPPDLDSDRKGQSPENALVIMSIEDGIIRAEFDGQPIRAGLLPNGEPYFVAADLCNALEISNPSTSVARLDDDEKGINPVYTLGGEQDVIVVSEPGLYNLVLSARTRSPKVKAFKRWVTHDLIPAVRHHGFYISGALTPEQAEQLKAEIARLEQQTARLEQQTARLEQQTDGLTAAVIDQAIETDRLARIVAAQRKQLDEDALTAWQEDFDQDGQAEDEDNADELP